MAHTKYTTVLAQAIYNNILTNKTTLGFDEVYFGDQTMIPVANACVVTAGPKSTTLAGVAGPGGRVTRTMTVFINILRQVVASALDVNAGTEATERLIVEQMAETVEDLLHQDTTVGGLIIHGYCVSLEPGDAKINNSVYRAATLTFNGLTKLNLS